MVTRLGQFTDHYRKKFFPFCKMLAIHQRVRILLFNPDFPQFIIPGQGMKIIINDCTCQLVRNIIDMTSVDNADKFIANLQEPKINESVSCSSSSSIASQSTSIAALVGQSGKVNPCGCLTYLNSFCPFLPYQSSPLEGIYIRY